MNREALPISGTEAALWLLALVAVGIVMHLVASWVASFNWRSLQSAYSATSKPAGPQWRMASGHIADAVYQAILNVVVGDEGVYLGTCFLYFHKPVLIPWQVLAEGRSTSEEFCVPTPRGPVRIHISGEAGRAIESKLAVPQF